MDFLLLGLILCILLFSSYRNDNYFSKEDMISLKGLLALIVVLHHITQKTTDGYYSVLFSNAGYLAVAGFFMISGYGLMHQVLHKGSSYLDNFFSRKVFRLVLEYMIITVIYYLFRKYILGESMRLSDIRTSFIQGYPITQYSWYVIAIIYFYTIFYLIFRIVKLQYKLGILLCIVGTFSYIFICHKFYVGSWWYNSVGAFVIGITWRYCQDCIEQKLKKLYNFIMSIICVLYWMIMNYMDEVLILIGYNISLKTNVFKGLLLSSLFAFFIFHIGYKCNIKNKVFEFIGGISLEFYLYQGMVLSFFRSRVVHIQNDTLYSIIVIVECVVVAMLGQKGMQYLMKYYDSMVDTVVIKRKVNLE